MEDEGEAPTPRDWRCTKCSEKFVTPALLQTHRRIRCMQADDAQYNYVFEEKRKLFICKTCDLELADKSGMEEHVLAHEDKFVCGVCRKNFTVPFEYSVHVHDHDRTKDLQCPLCKFNTFRRASLKIHINTKHLRKYIYTCEKCGKGFNDCIRYKDHNNVHEGTKPFRCVVCNKGFSYSNYLTNHQIQFHRVEIDGMFWPNQCHVCYKRFSKKSTLENHTKKHRNEGGVGSEKRHLCDVCGRSFAYKQKLNIHYRTHTGVKPYTCSYCAKSFTKKDYLVVHERVHSGEKPFSCEYCGKSFNQSASWRVHERIHTGERPYICHICKSGFISRSALNMHFKHCPGA